VFKPIRSTRRYLDEVDPAAAEQFVDLFYSENPEAGDHDRRLRSVRAEIADTGTYRHTKEELTFGARVAWRNSARCIGRLYWQSLAVRDLRSVTRADEVARHCVEHLRIATNGGRIRPIISVFAPDRPGRPGPRIWNEQLVRYAGYQRPAGGILGDPRYEGFTAAVAQMGWEPPVPVGRFDVLPLVIETVEDGPRLFPVPGDAVLEVPLSHPDLPWFADLGLRWHAVPALSHMRLVIGGISYPAAPFSGWYMGTEIGARNLADTNRYNLIDEVADRLGLDTTSERTLWRDRALVELNRAVLHSFNETKVTITDHHTEARRFLTHISREEAADRICPADWSWIVPPMSGAQTPVFHRYYDSDEQWPNFVTDDDAVQRALYGAPRCF
jgi:nitric-oxide synthase, bacterial